MSDVTPPTTSTTKPPNAAPPRTDHSQNRGNIVTPNHLLTNPDVGASAPKFVFASPLPSQPDARAVFDAKHLPGAVYWDVNAFSDQDSPFYHMLPPPEKVLTSVRACPLNACIPDR